MKISSVSQMRSLDRRAIEEFGIKEELLMENAGHTAYYALRKEFGIREKRFLVFCGTGNNGGDGCVLARKIHADGGGVKVFVLGDPSNFKGAAKLNYEIVTRLPVEVQRLASVEELRDEITHFDLIVDAIFGTGLSRDVGGVHRSAIEIINQSGKPVLSIDIPSGVHGDTGKVMGVAVKADYTVTFGLPKLGNMLYPGYDLGGKLYVSHISFPPSIISADNLKVEINHPLEFPPKEKGEQEGDFGEILFISGASTLGVKSCLKAGGGLTRLAIPSSLATVMSNIDDKITVIPQKETFGGNLSYENKLDLLELSEQVDMVVLGTGLFLEAETQRLVRELVAEIDKPLLVDGDNIITLRETRHFLGSQQKPYVLMLDINELSNITGKSAQEVEINKVDILQNTTETINTTIVLKGERPLIGFPDQSVYINLSGSLGMNSEKLWDALDGTIAAMYSRGLPLQQAVRQGVFIHGLAGDLTTEDHHQGEIATQDFLNTLPRAVKMVQEGLDTELEKRYAGKQIV